MFNHTCFWRGDKNGSVSGGRTNMMMSQIWSISEACHLWCYKGLIPRVVKKNVGPQSGSGDFKRSEIFLLVTGQMHILVLGNTGEVNSERSLIRLKQTAIYSLSTVDAFTARGWQIQFDTSDCPPTPACPQSQPPTPGSRWDVLCVCGGCTLPVCAPLLNKWQEVLNAFSFFLRTQCSHTVTMASAWHHGAATPSRGKPASVFPLLQQKQQLLLSFPSIFSSGMKCQKRQMSCWVFFWCWLVLSQLWVFGWGMAELYSTCLHWRRCANWRHICDMWWRAARRNDTCFAWRVQQQQKKDHRRPTEGM